MLRKFFLEVSRSKGRGAMDMLRCPKMISQFSGAVLDHERRHRFLLWRFWDERPRILFVGMNPSTADEVADDPTTRRCIDFARRFGYGGMYFCNVYSYRATDPKDLLANEYHHHANIPAVMMAIELSQIVVLAWGDCICAVPDWKHGTQLVIQQVPVPMCFGKTAHGNPLHPLYLPGSAHLEAFNA